MYGILIYHTFSFFLDVIIFVHILVYLVNYFYVWNSAHFINIDANFYILFWILFLNGHINILFLFYFYMAMRKNYFVLNAYNKLCIKTVPTL